MMSVDEEHSKKKAAMAVQVQREEGGETRRSVHFSSRVASWPQQSLCRCTSTVQPYSLQRPAVGNRTALTALSALAALSASAAGADAIAGSSPLNKELC